MKRLIAIEGFDRCGKDTLVTDLKNIDGLAVLENDLTGLPKYDKEEGNFLVWLNQYTDWQIKQINKLFETCDNVVLSRFIVSDEVYSKMFNREHTTIKYLHKLPKDTEIITYCLLFNDYNEYLKRLQMIGDDNIQYSKDEFNKINNLYLQETEKNSKSWYIKHVMANNSREDIKKDFITKIK